MEDEKEIIGHEHSATVGDLLDFIEKYKIPRDSKILTQRIEDVYFEKHNWTTIKKKGWIYNQELEHQQKAIDGTYNNKENYPLMDEETIEKFKNLDLTFLLEEYIVVWWPAYYPESKHLFLNCHY